MKYLPLLLLLLASAAHTTEFELTVDSKGVNRSLSWDDVAQEYEVVWVGDIIAVTTDSFYEGKILKNGWVRHSHVRIDAYDMAETILWVCASADPCTPTQIVIIERTKVGESNTVILN